MLICFSSTAQPVRRHDNVASLLRLQANAKLTKDRLNQPKGSGPSDNLRGPRCPDGTSAKQSYPASNSMRAGHRAQSVQNICRIPVAVAANTKTHLPVGRSTVKRAASSQNISSKSSQPLRPPVNAATAYNAELLANFEREKKTLEARIADLTSQLEEAKEREEMSGSADSNELASLRAENESLREELAKEQQLRASSLDEHFTDAEKLRLLQWQTHSPQQRNSVSDLSDLRTSFDSRPVAAGGLDRRSSVSVDCGLDHGPASVSALRDRLALMKVYYYLLLTFSFCFIILFSVINPGLAWCTKASQNEPFWEFLQQNFLQLGCSFCCQSRSDKALMDSVD